MSFTKSSDIYVKSKLDFPMSVIHIQFFLDSSQFQVNWGNIHHTLTIDNVALALNIAS